MTPTDQETARARLDVLVGEWIEEAAFGDAPAGHTTFEWALDGRFLLQRSAIADPAFPDTVAVIATNDDGTHTQHYFDARGIARIYKMTLTDDRWTLLRDAPDFTPLDFFQRFVGTIAPDGGTISGQWESSDDGTSWVKDFDLVYRRTTRPS